MAEHLTDEEQSERIKKWWADNYKSLLMSIVIVAAGFYGYNSYTRHQTNQQEQASELFSKLVEQTQKKQWENVAETANLLIKADTVTAYSQSARLSLAKVAVVKENYPQAITELKTLIDEGKDSALVEVAKIRLARVYLQTKQYDEGLNLLDTINAEEFAPQQLELRGDLLKQKGDKAGAIKAYEDAENKAQALNIPMQGISRKLNHIKTVD